jgi:hypothetical protein
MVCGPLFFCLLFKCGCVLQDLWPFLLAALQKKIGVELNAAADLNPGCFSMLEADLISC